MGVADKLSGKPRGYGFIEFERLEDMKRAYKLGMNRNIEGKRIIVDVERGRTVADWKPRRLGGGLGGERRITPMKSTTKKISGSVCHGSSAFLKDSNKSYPFKNRIQT